MGKESPRQLLSSSHLAGLGVGEGVELMSGNTPFNDAPSNSVDRFFFLGLLLTSASSRSTRTKKYKELCQHL